MSANKQQRTSNRRSQLSEGTPVIANDIKLANPVKGGAEVRFTMVGVLTGLVLNGVVELYSIQLDELALTTTVEEQELVVTWSTLPESGSKLLLRFNSNAVRNKFGGQLLAGEWELPEDPISPISTSVETVTAVGQDVILALDSAGGRLYANAPGMLVNVTNPEVAVGFVLSGNELRYQFTGIPQSGDEVTLPVAEGEWLNSTLGALNGGTWFIA